MAFVTAVLLIVLVFAGIPLQVAAHTARVVNDVGTVHGVLYIIYLITAYSLVRRLSIPRWKAFLVLLAGTVPICAFVAERKMTHRFDEVVGRGPARSGRGTSLGPTRSAGSVSTGGAVPQTQPDPETGAEHGSSWGRSHALRSRWFSPRALVLHAEVLVVAPGCAVAGWWQATSALRGNDLSWVYSVEWPIFCVLAILGWWHLLHEDPDAWRARRWRSTKRDADAYGRAAGGTVAVGADDVAGLADYVVEPGTGRWARLLLVGVCIEFLVGMVALFVIPYGRPAGWLPDQGRALYGVHATIGLFVSLLAVAFVMRSWRLGRVARVSSWCGTVFLVLASVGGLMTAATSLVRFLGLALMIAASLLAGCTYVVPLVFRARTRMAEAAIGEDAPLYQQTLRVPSGGGAS